MAQAGERVVSGRPIPGRALALLTAVVLLAHAAALQNARFVLDASEPLSTRVFTTRAVQIRPAPAQPEMAVPRTPVAPKPREVADIAPVAGTPAARQAPPVGAPDTPIYDLAAPVALQEPGTPREAATLAAQAAEAAYARLVATMQEQQNAPAPALPPSTEAVAPPAPLPKDAALPQRNYTVPGSIRLKFNATGLRSRMSYSARGELLWLHDGSSYEARLEAGAFLIGSRVGTSSGRITADGLAPNRYSDKGKTELAAHFERDKGRITFSANTPEAALLPGAQDRLSVFIQLAAQIAGEPANYPVGTILAFQTASQRAAESWVFVVEGEERLSLPGGEQPSLKLVRAPRKEFDQKVELWLAPALGYLPARIRLTEGNGDFLDLQWRSTSAP